MTTITRAILLELLDYDADTGVFTWKRRARRWFPDKKSQSTWNSRYAGQRAFNSRHSKGRRSGRLLRQTYLTHRVVWMYMVGKWPFPEIDHKNGDPADNRFCNLRECTGLENHHNRPLYANNTSGHLGVRQLRSGRYLARICVAGRILNLGHYANFERAVAARRKAERKYDFWPEHGRRAAAHLTSRSA